MQETRPVFDDLHSLGIWLREQQRQRATLLTFRLMTGLSLPQLNQALDAMLPMVQCHSRRIRRERYGYTVTATLRYREGVRMADAWRSGDLSGLCERERTALTEALAIVRQVNETDDDARFRALHDALTAKASYECPRIGSLRYGDIVGAVSALTEGCANCQGISDAMYLLGTLAGFDLGCQYGRNRQGVHLWNTVRQGDRWYAVDATYAVVHGTGERIFLDENACRERGLSWELWAETEKLALD